MMPRALDRRRFRRRMRRLRVEGWRTDYCHRFEMKARYPLLVDNLFDLSHLAFIHRTFVTDPTVELAEPAIEDRDGSWSWCANCSMRPSIS